jgi:hypothetical protein
MPSCAPTSKPGFQLTSKPGKLLSFYSGPNTDQPADYNACERALNFGSR